MPLVNGDNKQNLFAFALIVAASAGGSGVYRFASPPRNVEITEAQIHSLSSQRRVELEQLESRIAIQISRMEWGIRRDMPPEPIRRRLRAIELKLQELDPNWSPPTTDYSDF